MGHGMGPFQDFSDYYYLLLLRHLLHTFKSKGKNTFTSRRPAPAESLLQLEVAW